MEKQEIGSEIKELLDRQHFGVLATQSADYPYCSLVAYANTHDLRKIIFATVTDTRKYENLKNKPKVCLLIDSQTNAADDISNARALTILGIAKPVPAQEKQEYLSIYLQKHPYLKEFAEQENCVLIKVEAEKYILVKDFQNVSEYAL